MDGNTQGTCHLHLSGSCCHHHTGTPPWRPGIGLPAVAVSLPVLLLYLEVFPRSRPDEGGGTQLVLGSPDNYMGDSAPPRVSDYAGGFELYVPVL